MTHCNTIVEHSAHLDVAFSWKKTLMRSMQPMMSASRQHLADTVCKIRRAVRALLL
jgi:hypothetical protein